MRKAVSSALVVVLMTLVVPVIGASSPVAAQAAEENAFVGAINQMRAEAGLPSLAVHGELTALSRSWAQTMAGQGEIFHASPISAGLTAPWLKLGENVGVGPTVGALMDAFRASSGHYANIVDPEFTHVGVGVVWAGNVMYTTHRFMKMGSAPPPPPPPPSTTAPPPPTAAPSTTLPPAPPTTAPTTAAEPVPEPAAAPPPPTTTPPAADPDRVAVALRTIYAVTG